MAYYRTCPDCGAALDPEEKCDCKDEKKREQEFFTQYLKREPEEGQLAFVFNNRKVYPESKSC